MPNDLIKVQGHAGLARDPVSGAILNTDKAGYNAYLAKRRAALESRKELEDTKQELNNVKQELSELKDLVRQLLNKE